MPNLFTPILERQFHAALSMLTECLHRCPDEHWDGPIARYPFWQVAYHALCFTDVYLSPSEQAWQPQTGPGGLHPAGHRELEWESPSRRFTRPELLAYAALCRRKATAALAAETPETLAGESGFPHRKFTRAELHLYNLRHVQHHAGQFTAYGTPAASKRPGPAAAGARRKNCEHPASRPARCLGGLLVWGSDSSLRNLEDEVYQWLRYSLA